VSDHRLCCVAVFYPGKKYRLCPCQSDTTQQINLSQVEIVARRQEVYSALARVVTVVTKEEIQNAPVKTLSDLLRYIPVLISVNGVPMGYRPI
jgi:outer membrane receptor for ferrienterochelin and colicin